MSQNKLKVCSVRRSGTHLLMALIYSNFHFDYDLSLEMKTKYGNKWLLTGEKKAIVPWGKLFGTHKIFDEEYKDAIYIYRHPVDVMRSRWEFSGKAEKLFEFVTEEKVKNWKLHVDSYFEADVFTVNYNQLLSTPVAVLSTIKNRYNLQMVDSKYRCRIKTRVGWQPKRRMTINEGYNIATLEMMRDILGVEYRGFRI